ncbi:MAG TPA: cobalt ECF transporter T component CbiQ [Acidimicrobiales bacterium]|nr:cobalt ECF transporter T component CbiQ [Acidimicrobiales bacterium]
MSGGHGHAHGLYRPGHTIVHRLRPQTKVAAALAFVFAVVATPRAAFWAFGVDALVLVVVARLAAVPLPVLVRRLVIELPFVAFAVFLPLIGQAPHTDVLGLSLSVPGLWGAWNILVKGTLGVSTTILLASTTSIAELLGGLDRLHVPRAFTAIAGFMVRYAEVITGEARRMRIARLSRGYDPRWLWQGRALASSAGTLFIRSFERGERIHVAMLSRGFTGELPAASRDDAGAREWLLVSLVPLVAATAAFTAWMTA